MAYQRFRDGNDLPREGGISHSRRVSVSDTISSLESLDSPILTPKTEAATPPLGDDTRPAQQQPTGDFVKFGANPRWKAGLLLQMMPHPENRWIYRDYALSEWVAVMRVQCDDISRLMREGFFWTAENALPSENRIIRATEAEWAAKGLWYTRRWMLAEKRPDGTGPRWVAQLDVMSSFSDMILPDFRLKALLRKQIFMARAWKGPNEDVYRYELDTPSKNYNRISGGEPLQGWWPWPRQEKSGSLWSWLKGGAGVGDPASGERSFRDELSPATATLTFWARRSRGRVDARVWVLELDCAATAMFTLVMAAFAVLAVVLGTLSTRGEGTDRRLGR
jgi:hypothetical protein